MQPCQRLVHGIVDGMTLAGVHARKLRLPQDAPLDTLHHVEHRSDNAFIRAQSIGSWHGKAGWVQCTDDPELPVDSMCRRQELSRRLAPQHIFRARRDQLIGRIRLTALELANGQRPLEPFDMRAEIGLKPRRIERVLRRNILCAAELFLSGYLCHGWKCFRE